MTDGSRLKAPILSILRGVLNIEDNQGLSIYYAVDIIPSEGDSSTINTTDTALIISDYTSVDVAEYQFRAVAVSGSTRFENSVPSNTVRYSLIEQRLNQPSISIVNGILNIVPNDERTEGYVVYLATSMGTQTIETASTTVDLNALSFTTSPVTVTVVSVSSGYYASEPSEALTYTITLPAPVIALDGDILTLSDASSLAEEFEIYANGILKATVPVSVTYTVEPNEAGGYTYTITSEDYTAESNSAGGTTYTIGG